MTTLKVEDSLSRALTREIACSKEIQKFRVSYRKHREGQCRRLKDIQTELELRSPMHLMKILGDVYNSNNDDNIASGNLMLEETLKELHELNQWRFSYQSYRGGKVGTGAHGELIDVVAG